MRGTTTLGRPLSVIVATVTLLFLATSCGGESTPTATPTPVLSDVLTSAGERMAAMSTAKFSMVDEKETGAKFFETTFKNMEAELESPDRFRMLVEVVAPAFGFVEVEMIGVGDQAVMKFSKDAPWAPLPLDQVPFNFKNVGMTFRDIIHMIRDGDGAITGSESIQGAPAVLVEGTLQSQRLSNFVSDVDPGHTLTITMWIDEGDHALRQLRLAGKLFDDDAPETTRLVTINGIDVPVDIELPDVGSGQ